MEGVDGVTDRAKAVERFASLLARNECFRNTVKKELGDDFEALLNNPEALSDLMIDAGAGTLAAGFGALAKGAKAPNACGNCSRRWTGSRRKGRESKIWMRTPSARYYRVAESRATAPALRLETGRILPQIVASL